MATGLIDSRVDPTDVLDDLHLEKLGYKPELSRKVTFWGSVGITLGSIQPLLCAGVFYFGFGWGGPVQIIWGFLGLFAWSTFLALSMAEISSQYTVAGGPYYWAGALAGKLGQLPAYISGWMTFLNVLGGIVSYEFQSAQQILAMRLMYTNDKWYHTPPGMLGITKGVSFGVPLPNVMHMPFQKAMYGIMCGLATLHALTSFIPVKHMNRIAMMSFAWLCMICSVIIFALPAVTPRRNSAAYIFTTWIPSSADAVSASDFAPAPAPAPSPAGANATSAGYITTAANVSIPLGANGTLPANLTAASMYGPLINANVGLVTGLPNDGYTAMVGLLMTQYLMTYYDVPSHMAEETHDAARTVPRAIMASFIIAGFTNFAMLIALIACLNLDNYQYDFLWLTPLQHKDNRIASGNFLFGGVTNGLFPVGNIFYDSFMSRFGSANGAVAMTFFIFIGTQFTAVMNFTFFSRFLYSFARDGGLPFSSVFARIEPRTQVPVNALMLSLVGVFCLMSPILTENWFQKINAMTAFVNGQLWVWAVPPMLRIINRHLFKPSPGFDLGRFSIPCALLAAGYNLFSIATIALPNTLPATKMNFNFAPVILGAVLLYSLLSYPFMIYFKLFRGPALAAEDFADAPAGGAHAGPEDTARGAHHVNAAAAEKVRKTLEF